MQIRTRFIAGAAVVVALIAGLLAGSAINISQGARAPAVAPLTAYVDFQTLLKEDNLLAREQFRIDAHLQDLERERSNKFRKEEQAIVDSVKDLKAEDPAQRRAMNQLDKLRYEFTLDMNTYRMAAAEDLRTAGIDAFKRLRSLTDDIARGLGYTQVLNIAGDLSELVGAGQDDFKMLQRQLLLSPVLTYDKDHDITKEVRVQAELLWDSHIEIGDIKAHEVVPNGGAAAELALEVDAEHPDGVFEIELGKKVKFSVTVQKKDEPAQGEDAEVSWRRTGIGAGVLDEATGDYTAPDSMPQGGPEFELFVRSVADPTQTKRVTIRLLAP